jgi:hypothetical protein
VWASLEVGVRARSKVFATQRSRVGCNPGGGSGIEDERQEVTALVITTMEIVLFGLALIVFIVGAIMLLRSR